MGSLAAFKRLLDLAEVNADCVSRAAERDLQHVLDRLRTGDLTRSQLAVLARAVSAELAALERRIASATAAIRRERDEAKRWQQAIAEAQGDSPELAARARDRLAYCLAGVAAAEAVLFEHRETEAHLRAVGRLVLERAQI